MARLTKEQREMLCNLCRCTPHNKAFVDSILRLDEEVEPVHPSHLTTVVKNLECERDEARAERDEANAMLGQLQSAFSAAVCVVIKTGHHRTTPVLAEAVSLIVAERDEARSVCANQEATIVDLGEVIVSAIDEREEAKADLDALARAVAQALMVPTLNDREELVDPIDHAIVGAMLGMRNARDTALARLAKVEAERDEARAKLAEVGRLLAIEEQAKRVARAEKWVSMADLALLDANESDLWNSRDTWKRARAWENLCNEAWTMACSGFQSERRKLYEMVGEGES